MDVHRYRRWVPLAPVLALTAVTAHAQTPRAAVPAQIPSAPESALLQDCHVAVDQAGRYATFAAQMTAVPRTQHMAIRVDVQERDPAAPTFHDLIAPGLDVWR